MKTLVATAAVIMLFGAGCTSTVTLGPKANDSTVLGASADAEGASLTLPLIKASVGTTTTTETKKK
jgi:hypothetical protein